jgi:large subunit ribosomal protein L19
MENSTETTQNKENGVVAASFTDFSVGDKVVVNYKIKEGEKFRTQPYEGIVIAKKGAGMSKTFTVRRIGAGSVGIERIFPLYSPNIDSITVKSRGKVRRSKLYYLRSRIGKSATKIKTRVTA